MFRFYIGSLGSMFFLIVMLVTSTVSMFVFKNKLHSIKSEFAATDAELQSQKKRAAMLEASRTLQHSPSYLKLIADKKLGAKFTTVRQFASINDIKSNRKA